MRWTFSGDLRKILTDSATEQESPALLPWRPLTIQKSQQFGARYEQLAAKRTARPKFSALDQSINTKIIDA
jgi:hypothetical protein